MADALSDFTLVDKTCDGVTKPVYTKGSGPGVIVLAEIPGITPLVADFARRVVDLGCTVWMPSLFGTPGKEPSNAYAASSLLKACISSEFTAITTRKNSPAAEWARSLGRELHAEAGGPGIGFVGMCLTGGFALAAMADPSVLAPVLSQPSLPFPTSKKAKRDLGIDDETLAAVKARAADGVCVLGLRFTDDVAVPAARFARLEEELGDSFIGVSIDSSKGNPYGIKGTAHSVLTEDLVDEPGHPTRAALEQVLEHFRTNLGLA